MPDGRAERFAPIAELALCSFSPCDLVLIHYIRGLIFCFLSVKHKS